jgi:long-chain fatty acid transport protein
MRKRLLGLSIASAFSFAGTAAHASGFALWEQGASGLGNAYAGSAAVAEDASTVWWNPAGMARLGSGKHIAFAGEYIMPSTKFSNNGSSAAAASNQSLVGDGGDAGSSAFVPQVFFAMDLNPKWNVGVAVTTPFGLKTEYDSNWIGRFQGIKSEVKTYNINPAVSYKLSDSASLGFGVSYQHGEVDLVSGVNYSGIAFGAGGGALLTAVGGPGVEGQNSTNLDGDAWGFNVGGLFDLSQATRIGVHYRSSLDYSLKGSTTFSGVPTALSTSPLLSNGDVKLDLKTPASASVSVAHKMNEKVELLGDVTWTQWSKIDQLPLLRTSGPANGTTLDTLRFNFDDTWRVSFGVNYKYNGPWTLKAGVAYDQAPVPSAQDRSVRLPDSDRYWLSLGASYSVNQASRFDLGYTYVMVKDADINNDQSAAGRGIVNGTYKANVNVFGLQYQHTF